jgi:hypothetical protein
VSISNRLFTPNVQFFILIIAGTMRVFVSTEINSASQINIPLKAKSKTIDKRTEDW